MIFFLFKLSLKNLIVNCIYYMYQQYQVIIKLRAFFGRRGRWVGWGCDSNRKKISYQSPWSPCLMMTSSLLKVTCPQFRMISFKYSEMMKTFSIKYRRSHNINSYEIKRAELHILEKRKKKTFNRIILFCIAYQCNPWESLPIYFVNNVY